MGKYTERVDSELETIIYEKIEKNAQLSPENRAQLNALREFRDRNISRCNTSRKKTKVLTYTMLPELLAIANMTIKDMYKLIGIDITWPTDDAAELCTICDNASPELRKKMLKTALAMAPNFWWKDPTAKNAQPTRRAITLLDRKYYRANRRTMEDGKVTPALLKVWEDQKFFTSLNTKEFPPIASSFEVSLHWLLRLGDNVRVLAEYPETEEIMTAYLFMAPPVRNIFFCGAKRAAVREDKDNGIC